MTYTNDMYIFLSRNCVMVNEKQQSANKAKETAVYISKMMTRSKTGQLESNI